MCTDTYKYVEVVTNVYKYVKMRIKTYECGDGLKHEEIVCFCCVCVCVCVCGVLFPFPRMYYVDVLM